MGSHNRSQVLHLRPEHFSTEPGYQTCPHKGQHASELPRSLLKTHLLKLTRIVSALVGLAFLTLSQVLLMLPAQEHTLRKTEPSLEQSTPNRSTPGMLESSMKWESKKGPNSELWRPDSCLLPEENSRT